MEKLGTSKRLRTSKNSPRFCKIHKLLTWLNTSYAFDSLIALLQGPVMGFKTVDNVHKQRRRLETSSLRDKSSEKGVREIFLQEIFLASINKEKKVPCSEEPKRENTFY